MSLSMFEVVKRFWLPVLTIALIAALAISANQYKSKSEREAERADNAENDLAMANDTIIDMQIRQRNVAELDAKYTKELADAKAENDALHRKLDNGGRVLVNGRCPVPASTNTSAPASVGYDATVELSSVAGRNVLGIRAGIVHDQTALRVLQEYIRKQCLE